jgi:hypothetical protein
MAQMLDMTMLTLLPPSRVCVADWYGHVLVDGTQFTERQEESHDDPNNLEVVGMLNASGQLTIIYPIEQENALFSAEQMASSNNSHQALRQHEATTSNSTNSSVSQAANGCTLRGNSNLTSPATVASSDALEVLSARMAGELAGVAARMRRGSENWDRDRHDSATADIVRIHTNTVASASARAGAEAGTIAASQNGRLGYATEVEGRVNSHREDFHTSPTVSVTSSRNTTSAQISVPSLSANNTDSEPSTTTDTHTHTHHPISWYPASHARAY